MTKLAKRGIRPARDHEADGQECHTHRPGGRGGYDRDDTETTDDDCEHTEHECHYRQRARAAVEDENSTAIICDDESACVGECSGLGWCGHACSVPSAAASVHRIAEMRLAVLVAAGNPAAGPIGDRHTVRATSGAKQVVHRVVGDAPPLALQAPQGAENNHCAPS